MEHSSSCAIDPNDPWGDTCTCGGVPTGQPAVEPEQAPVGVMTPENPVRPSAAILEGKDGHSEPRAVATKAPIGQSDHRKALWMSKDLKKNPMALLAALAAHNIVGVGQGNTFGLRPQQIAASLIARETGMSVRTAQRAMTEATKLGYFRRVDNGKGGKNSTNASTYVPTVPAWWRS